MPTHFTPEAIKFLRGLAKNNDRDWFNARKAIYERELKAPMLALVEEINHALAEFAPEHVRQPNKTMMRIYRDTRFAKDKRPYKPHVSAWWARRGMEKTTGGGFYLQIEPKQVLVSIGVYMPAREQLYAIRTWLAENHASYNKLYNATLKSRTAGFTTIDPQALTRMPKGFPADHPAGALLRANNWGVHVALPAELATSATLVREVVKRFRLAAPLVDALNGAILNPEGAPEDAPRKLSRPMF